MQPLVISIYNDGDRFIRLRRLYKFRGEQSALNLYACIGTLIALTNNSVRVTCVCDAHSEYE